MSVQKSADGIVVSVYRDEGQNAEMNGALHKLDFGDESDTDEPDAGAL